MLSYLIVCQSITYAQRVARLLERAGITASIARAPQGIAREGCKYCVRVAELRLMDAQRIIKGAGLPTEGVYLQNSDGTVGKVY